MVLIKRTKKTTDRIILWIQYAKKNTNKTQPFSIIHQGQPEHKLIFVSSWNSGCFWWYLNEKIICVASFWSNKFSAFTGETNSNILVWLWWWKKNLNHQTSNFPYGENGCYNAGWAGLIEWASQGDCANGNYSKKISTAPSRQADPMLLDVCNSVQVFLHFQELSKDYLVV